MPFRAGHYEALRLGGIAVLTHPWIQGATVFYLDRVGLGTVEDAGEAAHLIAAADQAASIALPPDQSLAFIARAGDQWRETDA